MQPERAQSPPERLYLGKRRPHTGTTNPGKGKRKTEPNVKQKVKLVKYSEPEINVSVTRRVRTKKTV